MARYRIQAHVELKAPEAGTLSVLQYEIEAERHGYATIEGRKRAKSEPSVRKVTLVTWEEMK